MEQYMRTCSQETEPEVITAVTQALQLESHEREPWLCPSTIAAACADVEQERVTSPVAEISTEALKKAQEEDSVIGKVREYIVTGQWPRLGGRDRCDDISVLIRDRNKLYVNEDGILYRKSVARAQLVLPKTFHQRIYWELHEEMGHLGVERTLSLIRDRFYWPHMQRDVDHYVTRVCSCLKQVKCPNKPTRAPLVNVITTYPFEMVSINYLHLESCKGGYEYILVIIVIKFRFPAKLHHDQGKEFENKLFSKMEEYCRIQGSRTTPYHAAGNGTYRLASETAQKEQKRAKKQYDRKTYGVELQPGSRVLVRNFKERGGPGKLRSYWEDEVNVWEEEEIRRKRKSHTDKRKERQVKQKNRDPDSSSEDESDWRFITTRPSESSNQVRSQLRVEAEEFQPQAADREVEQGGENDVSPEEDEDGRMEPVVERGETAGAEGDASSDAAEELNSEQEASSDEADEGDPEPQLPPTRKYPLRQRNPPKTLTYNKLGQPSVTHRHN
ncbi:Pro-Pol polyprotein [Merluccius polli]|uniref:Gypsy retrotransposon integrase-like protein 1 n=1 Tax=Merluccius polli TaxID=89951 RepID=A0AA47MDC3_MERPO|nr:Pro-Pol polyprotein [Merluccius polli]